jgi:hypothetical protein
VILAASLCRRLLVRPRRSDAAFLILASQECPMRILHPRRYHTADDGQQPPVGAAPVVDFVTPAPTPAPVAATADPVDEPVITAAEARELRREAQSLRRRLREIEGVQTTTQSEAQQQVASLQAELDALRASHGQATEALRAYRLRDAIAETARGSDDLRGLDPDLAARLVEVEYGDDGKPKGLTAALRGLVERYPQIAAGPRVSAQPPAGKAQAAAVVTDDLIAQKRRQVGAI